jgi:hypothetical protein
LGVLTVDLLPRPDERIIPSWEYRHLRFWVGFRIVGGIACVGLGVVTFAFGGNDWKTFGWTMAFLAAAAANVARSVEKHVGNIFSKLGLAPSDADHRRVLAVLRYLES